MCAAPPEEERITADKVAARALHAWMTGEGIEEDFTACDTPMLNRFFRDYQTAHGQSGTNTKQRNLRHLFTWLEDEYGHPHPYTPRLNRYAPVTGRPHAPSPPACASAGIIGMPRRRRCGSGCATTAR